MNLYKQIIAFLSSKLGFPDVQKQHNSISRDARMDCPFIHQRWIQLWARILPRRDSTNETANSQIQISAHLHPNEIPFPCARDSRVRKMKTRDIVCNKTASKSRGCAISEKCQTRFDQKLHVVHFQDATACGLSCWLFRVTKRDLEVNFPANTSL